MSLSVEVIVSVLPDVASSYLLLAMAEGLRGLGVPVLDSGVSIAEFGWQVPTIYDRWFVPEASQFMMSEKKEFALCKY